MPPSLSDLSLRRLPRLPQLPPSARLIREALRTFDPRDWSSSSPTEALAMGILSLRSGLFLAESLPLFMLTAPARKQAPAAPPPPDGAIETTLARLRELLERDAALIGRGLAPFSVLAPRDPLGHGRRLLRILADGPAVSRRRRRRQSRDFSREARPWLDELPAYYRRNFHYQTDGYLSERSAELYEHQVELLFRGGADAMRRMIVPPLRDHFFGRTELRTQARAQTRAQGRRPDRSGRGLHFLELGSGTGSATRSVARCFPGAKITCVDLSHPYTRHARRQLAEFERIDCVQGDAASLDFADQRFDAVYSVFLFHELPLPVRESVLDEALRVLRPGGFLGIVDSLQSGDDPELDWALEFFPREFHEPFYANYSANPLRDLVAHAGFEAIESGTGYLAKWVAARTPGSVESRAQSGR